MAAFGVHGNEGFSVCYEEPPFSNLDSPLFLGPCAWRSTQGSLFSGVERPWEQLYSTVASREARFRPMGTNEEVRSTVSTASTASSTAADLQSDNLDDFAICHQKVGHDVREPLKVPLAGFEMEPAIIEPRGFGNFAGSSLPPPGLLSMFAPKPTQFSRPNANRRQQQMGCKDSFQAWHVVKCDRTAENAVVPEESPREPLPVGLVGSNDVTGQSGPAKSGQECAVGGLRKNAKKHVGEASLQKQHCSFIFQVTQRDVKEFQLVPRLIGRKGANMKRIADACNVRIRIRGRGSGFMEEHKMLEANIPLQMALSADDFAGYEKARGMLTEVLDAMAGRFEQYCLQRQINPPPAFYVLRETAPHRS